MKTLLNWPQNHPVAFPLILFVLAALISIYATDIKNFVHQWPKRKALETRKKSIETQLQVLRQLHGDSYRLLLFLGWQLSSAVIHGVIWGTVVSSIRAFSFHKYDMSTVFYAVAGAICGSSLNIRQILSRLYSYDDSIQKLSIELRDITETSSRKK